MIFILYPNREECAIIAKISALFLFVFPALFGCSSEPFYYGKVYLLDQSQVSMAQSKAENGDAEAAMALYRHYNLGLIKSDDNKAKYWLQKAARLGDPVAKHNLKALIEREYHQHGTVGKQPKGADM